MKLDAIEMIENLMWGDDSILVDLQEMKGLNINKYELLNEHLKLYAMANNKDEEMISKKIAHLFLYFVANMDVLSNFYQGKSHQEISNAFQDILEMIGECLDVNN